MNRRIPVTVGALLLICLLPTQLRAKDVRIEVPPAVAKLVVPILDAMVEVERAETEGRSSIELQNRLGRLLTRLFVDRTPFADEALVVLTQFYIGESNSEDCAHEITSRGKRMLPHLRRYRQNLARISNRTYPSSLGLDTGTWMGDIDADIDYIEDGKVRFQN